MKKSIALIAVALLATLFASVFSGVYSSDVYAEENIQTAYVSGYDASTKSSKSIKKKMKKILDEHEDFAGIYIGDLIGDEREDMVIALNPFGLFELYVPVGNNIQSYKFSVSSIWGFTKYISSERKFICMNEYGHTESTAFYIYMETVSFEKNKLNVHTISREPVFSDERYSTYADIMNHATFDDMIDGKKTDAGTFSNELYSLIAETAESEYIPFVEHNKGDMTTDYGEDGYKGKILSIDYSSYIKKKLG